MPHQAAAQPPHHEPTQQHPAVPPQQQPHQPQPAAPLAGPEPTPHAVEEAPIVPDDAEPTDGGRGGNRPSPVLLGLLAVVLIGFVVWNFVLKGDDETPIALPAPVTDTGTTPASTTPTGGGWADAVPKSLPDPVTDGNALDSREVAPKRFTAQMGVAREALQAGEEIRSIRIQPNGTLVVLAVAGDTARWVATKEDLDPQPVPTAEVLEAMQPLEEADIQARVPTKLLRATERADGVPPGEMLLQHLTAGPFGDAPAWTMTWSGLPTVIAASADGHDIEPT